MKRFFLVFIILIFLRGIARSGDAPFNYPSNFGITGLMAIPTARVMDKYKYRVGLSVIEPYRHLFVTFTPLKHLELNGMVTEIKGVRGFSGSAYKKYGSYKDKDIDFKYQIFGETKYIPAIAIGGNDLIGTRLYASQYLVFSKQIYPFDFTVGLANGRYGKKQLGRSRSTFEFEMLHHPISWLKNSKFFWGIEFAPSAKFAFMMDYNPTDYSKQTRDPAWKKYFKNKKVKSHFDFGVRYKPTKWSEIDLSYQRGEKFAFNFSMTFNIGKRMLPEYYPPYIEPYEYIKYPKLKRIALGLEKMGFSNIAISKFNNEIYIAAQNDKYFYPTRALGVVIQILESFKFDRNKIFHIILTNNFVPMFEFTTTQANIEDLKNGVFTNDEFLYMSKMKFKNIYLPDTDLLVNRKWYDYGLKPAIETFLNDPSGFFKYRAGISAYAKFFPWKGGTVFSSITKYFFNDISTINKPLSIPVRSDFPLYMEQKLTLESLLFNQYFKINGFYFRFTGGLLETEYAGLDLEAAKPLFSGKLDLGIGGSIVKKRAYKNVFGFEYGSNIKRFYTPAFVYSRYYLNPDLFVDLKAGRFLAGDRGVKFSVSKDIGGVILSAWYTMTDTSVFKDNVNKGYHDYGVALSLPLRLFTKKDTKTTYYYSLSPWTRDVGQDIAHYGSLFDYLRKEQPNYLYAHGEEIFK